MKPKIDRWAMYGNVIVGYFYDTPGLETGERGYTLAVRFIDPVNMQAECLDGKYDLGTPGTLEEHRHPLLGRPPASADEIAKIDKAAFLNPNG